METLISSEKNGAGQGHRSDSELEHSSVKFPQQMMYFISDLKIHWELSHICTRDFLKRFPSSSEKEQRRWIIWNPSQINSLSKNSSEKKIL